MRTLVTMAGVIVVLLVPLALWGDIPGPGPRPPRPVPQMVAMPPPNVSFLLIEVNADIRQPRLLIPSPMLERVRAAEPEKRQETVEVIGLHIEHLLPALALALGGLCLLRGQARLAVAAALLLTVGVTLGVGRSRLEASAPVTSIRVGEVVLDDVEVIVSPEWGEVKLTLPPAVAARLAGRR